MKLDLFQIDAFTENTFGGNPAAVVPLKEWLSDDILQNIAMENNLSETAFFVKKEDHYEIRWMTPTVEIDLCGHATLATSYVIFNELKLESSKIRFSSKSGDLLITRHEDLITLNFPANVPEIVDCPTGLSEALGFPPRETLFNKSYLAIYDDEKIVREMKPNFTMFEKFETHGVIVSAPGSNYDFVSRFFIPSAGINEDPVTGFAHTLLTPYWSNKLNRKKLKAFQSSKRGGRLNVEALGDRVNISGKAVKYLKGEIEI